MEIKIKSDWQKVKLSEVAEIKYGKDHDHLEVGNFPCYGSGGIIRMVSEYLYDKESILIPRVGTIGNLFYSNKPFWTMNTLFWTKINEEKIFPRFLFYKFKTIDLAKMNLGSAVPRLTSSLLNEIKFEIPPLPEQKKIAGILSSLDDKIELNNQMNSTLEKISQEIFKRWFVDFEFPNEKGEPYKSSGGIMVESELGEIPTGWKVGSLDEILKIKNGFAFKSEQFSDSGEIGIIKIKNIYNSIINITDTQYIDEFYSEKIDRKFLVEAGRFLIAMTGAEIGKLGLVPSNNKKLYLNQRVGMIEEKFCGGNEYGYIFLQSKQGQDTIKNFASGSAQPNISGSELEGIKIVVPEKTCLEKFGKIMKNIFEEISDLSGNSLTLKEIRDLVLPKLMSGEVEIKN